MANMTEKRAARRVKESIVAHHIRTSDVYEKLAFAPYGAQMQYLEQCRNPILRRYISGRILEVKERIESERRGLLDPLPYVHQHFLCPLGGQRRSVEDFEDEHDSFEPRDGFISERSAYAGG